MKNYEERGISKILVEHNRFFVRHREHFLRINRSHNKHYRRDKGKIEKIIGEEGTKKILKIQEQIFKLEKDIQRFEKNKENNPRLRKMLDMIEDSKNSIIFKNNSNKKEKEGIENEKCAFLEQYYYQD
jgi:signal transduction histidine kinase